MDQDEIAVAEIMVGEVVSRVSLEALESGRGEPERDRNGTSGSRSGRGIFVC